MLYPSFRPILDASLRPLALGLALATIQAASGECGLPGSGSCAVPHAGVGCNDAACCTAVCNLDPFCCDVGWDEYCAGGAVETCGLTPPPIVVMGFGDPTVLPGNIEVSSCDLAAYNFATGLWSIYFDGDDVGLTGHMIKAAAITAAGDLVFAMETGGSLAGLAGGPFGNAFEAYDLLRFTPSSLGDSTAGNWTFHFDGSDVGLAGNLNLAYRTMSVQADGSILVAIRGTGTLPGGIAMTSHDLARFAPTSLGATTAGTWSMHFDGSDVGMSTSSERLDNACPRADGTLVLSMRGQFNVPGATGRDADFVLFMGSYGATTAGTFLRILTPELIGLPAGLSPRAYLETLAVYPVGPRPDAGGGGGSGGSPLSCGSPGTSSCCSPSDTPYCSDTACCEAVCAVDPICCSVGWDEYCAGAAARLCEGCMASPKAVMAFGEVSTLLPTGLLLNGCDLAAFDTETGLWSIWFDGDDVGLSGNLIRGATVLENDEILVVLENAGNLPGLVGGPNGNAFEGYDILRFTPSSLGNNTSGTWTFHFDGSDVGLAGNIDLYPRGFGSLADGSLIVSPRSDTSWPGLGPVTANDLLRFTPSSLGANTAGSWSMYFDGSDVGMTTVAERFDAAQVLPDGRIVMSLRGNFAVDGLTGNRVHLIDFTPTSLGENTAGTFSVRLTPAQLGLTTAFNPQSAFIHTPAIETESRPMLPVLFDTLPSASASADAIAAGHDQLLIIYQGVDPAAGSTGLIDVDLVIEAIRSQYGDNPSGYGILNFENPFIARLEAGPSDPNWQATVDTVVAAVRAVKAEFPQVKWTMYGMPLVRYWLPPAFAQSWADAPESLREQTIASVLAGFDPVLREFDWFNPGVYDRYELITFSAAEQPSLLAGEAAYRRTAVEICNRFNATSGLPRKPIIPMISPMFWKVGRISYNMKQMTLEELMRDSVRPLMQSGADGVAVWTGLSYWVRAATSALDLGSDQADARYALTQDFLGGTAPADWTSQALHDDLSFRTSEHVRAVLDAVRLEVYDILFAAPGG